MSGPVFKSAHDRTRRLDSAACDELTRRKKSLVGRSLAGMAHQRDVRIEEALDLAQWLRRRGSNSNVCQAIFWM